MRYLLLISIGLLMTGCVSSGGYTGKYTRNSVYTYQQPAKTYYIAPTSYRIKSYHPMNSGMGF